MRACAGARGRRRGSGRAPRRSMREAGAMSSRKNTASAPLASAPMSPSRPISIASSKPRGRNSATSISSSTMRRISPTGRAENFKREPGTNAMAVNLTAPMLLSQRVARRLIDTQKARAHHQHGFDLRGDGEFGLPPVGILRHQGGPRESHAPARGRMGAATTSWSMRSRPDGFRPKRPRVASRKRGNKERMEMFTPLGTPRSARRIARRGDFPRESGFELCHRHRAFRRWRLPILVSRLVSREILNSRQRAGARMDDRGKSEAATLPAQARRDPDGRCGDACGRTQARARRARPDAARNRRDRRRGYLRDDRRRRASGRPGPHPVVRTGGHRVHDGGAVLCGIRRDDSRSRAARIRTRTRRWASWSRGSSAGTWCSNMRWRGGRRSRMVGLLPRDPRGTGDPFAGRIHACSGQRARRHHRSARAHHRAAHHCGAVCRDFRERAAQFGHRRDQARPRWRS